MSEDRHSRADPVELIADPEERARREAENAVRQYKAAIEVIRGYVQRPEERFRLRQSLILDMHERVLVGIHPLAGTYRNTPVEIGMSNHIPPRSSEVADFVGDMCAYVNENWNERNALHLAAYVLWRTNWIHPFADGNGRTARVISYIVLSAKLNSVLPGSPTIPDLIASDKAPYYKHLEDADESWKYGHVALAGMENMLEQMLAEQLLSATREAAA